MGSSLTTLHIFSSRVSICDYFLGCLLWCPYHYSTSVLSKKAPEEVVTDGYEGATVYMCSVVRDDPIHCTSITFHYNEEGDGPPYQVPHLITPLMYSHSPPSIPPHGAGTMRARRVLFHRNATHRIDRNAPTAPPAAAAPARSPRHLR